MDPPAPGTQDDLSGESPGGLPESGQAAAEDALRDRVLSLVGAGQDVPEELLDAWARAKRESLARFRSLGAEKAPQYLSREIDRLDAELDRLEQGGQGNMGGQLQEALQLGERIRWLLWVLDALSGKASGDPLAFLEEEIGWVRRSSRDLGRRDASATDETNSILESTNQTRASLWRRKYQRFSRLARAVEAGQGTTTQETSLERATGEWGRVSESFELEWQLTFLRHRGAVSEELAGDLDELRRLRRVHVEACRSAVDAADPIELAQFVHRAVHDLADHASIVVSETAPGKLRQAIPALALLSQRVETLMDLLGASMRELPKSPALSADERKEAKKDLRLLKRLRRRARIGTLEAETNLRVERAFGARFVRIFENFLFVLILGFVALVFVEWHLPMDSPYLTTVHRLDLIACIVFQIDFFTRWAFSGWAGWYFLRHFFLESLPALPFGMIFHHIHQIHQMGALEEARAVIVVRILRSRYLLLLLRGARLFRVIFFFIRGADRSVEKLRGLLDRDVVLFESSFSEGGGDSPLRGRVLSIEGRRQKLARNIFSDAPWTARPWILRRHLLLVDLESRVASHLDLPYQSVQPEASGEIRLERVIWRLLECDAATVISYLGYDGAKRVARWLRLMDVPLIRRLPVVRLLVPAGRIKDHPEAVATAARATGEMLANVLAVLRFWGDLAGITTGPQVLDRLASTIIAATKRPAFRLLMFGGLFVLVKLLVLLLVNVFSLHEGYFEKIFTFLAKFLGLPLIVLGSVCFVFLLAGKWFKKIAGEALDVFVRTSDAHFYPLLKIWKLRRRHSDIRFLYRSVFLPEVKIRPGGDAPEDDWVRFIEEPLLLDGGTMGLEPRFESFREDRDQLALLYRDFVDGPILQRLDDKTSVQLLGNLVIQELRIQTLGLSKKDLRRLEWLDLGKERLLTLGPYFWFRFITESLAIETAKLVLEYNTSCIPLDQQDIATPGAKKRHQEFFEVRRGRWDRAAAHRSAGAMEKVGEPLSTQYFSALDFLTVDPDRERITRRRFGDDIADALRKDRKDLIRDIFGTRPYHLLPRSERIFNPYKLYQRYFAGPRVLVFPLVLLARLGFAAAKQLVQLVEDVLGRDKAIESRLPRTAGFDVAARKLNRMRKPFFMEALRLRAAVDVEYLGLRLPGIERQRDGRTFEEDLDFIGAAEVERRPLEGVKAAALRDLRRFRNFLAARSWGSSELDGLLSSLDPSGMLLRHRGEVIRAMVTAYITDHASLRTHITASDSMREFIEDSIERKRTLLPWIGRKILAGAVRLLPRGRRRASLLARYLRSVVEFEAIRGGARRKVLRDFLLAPAKVELVCAYDLEQKRLEGEGGDGIFDELRSVALDFASWTRKVMTVRGLQAVTVLDVESYRDLIHDLGEYGEADVR